MSGRFARIRESLGLLVVSASNFSENYHCLQLLQDEWDQSILEFQNLRYTESIPFVILCAVRISGSSEEHFGVLPSTDL